jgi:hypothetical protein
MLVLPMASLSNHQIPPVTLKHFDNITDFHLE